MNRRNLFSFLVAFLLLISVIVIDRKSFGNMVEFTASVDHTREVITSFEKLSAHVKSAEVYSSKYAQLYNQNFYRLYKNDIDELPSEIIYLKYLIRDNPVQRRRLDTLSALINSNLPVLKDKNITEMIQSGQAWRLNQLFQIHSVINRAIEHETGLLQQRKAALEKSAQNSSSLTIVFFGLATGLVIVTFLYNEFLVRRRQWLEGFLESVLNTSRSGIINYKAVRDKGKIVDFKVEYANNATKDLLNFAPEQLIGRRLLQVPEYDDARAGLMEKYCRVVNTGEREEFEAVYNIANKPTWFTVSLAKLEDGVTASFYNITQIKKYQEELQSNIKWLAQSNKELEEYAYVASHDLQEPLRKIMVYTSILISPVNQLHEKDRALLAKISYAANRMSYLIHDILNFSSLKREAAFVPTDLNEILAGVLEDLELKFEQTGAVIEKDNLPVIDAIPLQMTQLFHNLISNSLKFGQPNVQPVLSIRFHEMTVDEKKLSTELVHDRRYYKLTFSDNGIGFDAQYSDQIFGMFKRLNDKQHFPGSGIGLALCRKVVANHNGLIFASGSKNNGAEFIIILPKIQS